MKSPTYRKPHPPQPNPRHAPGKPGGGLKETVVWEPLLNPPEEYAIRYGDDQEEEGERIVKLLRLGQDRGVRYLGVVHQGKPKTMRADRVHSVRQLTEGHPCQISVLPTYSTQLPAWPVPDQVVKVPQSTGKRTWTVDLSRYACACPERRVREGMGYKPGQLGAVCPHLARAILQYLSANQSGWTQDLQEFLADPRKMSIDNLI